MNNNLNMANKEEKNVKNQSPVVKLSLEEEEIKNNIQRQNNEENMNNININQQMVPNNQPKDEIGQVINDTINTLSSTKVIKKKVEIVTTITYTYEDGSTKVITQNQTHEFNN